MPTTNSPQVSPAMVPPSKFRPILAISPKEPGRPTPAALTIHRIEGVGPATPWSNLPVHAGVALTALMAGTIATALQSLDALERQSREAAQDFRSTNVEPAKRSLKNLVQSTRTLIRLAAMTAHVAGTDVRTFCRISGFPADKETQNALDLLTARLLAKDWVALADLLDQEFTSALTDWRSIFEALGLYFCPGPEGFAA